MPTTAFNSCTDGLDPNRRKRDHFIANINVDDDRLWIPYAEGVWLQPCCFNVTSGGFSVVLKALPGAKLGIHYHVGTVRGYTMRGHWRYLEDDWIAKPGARYCPTVSQTSDRPIYPQGLGIRPSRRTGGKAPPRNASPHDIGCWLRRACGDDDPQPQRWTSGLPCAVHDR